MLSKRESGFSLVELLIVVATLAILMAIALPLLQDALVRANVSAVATDAKAVYIGFKRHYMDTNMYPNASNNPAFQLDSFEPLVSMSYYDGRVAAKLVNDQADGFDSPDDQGTNQEFWLEMTLEVDPSIRFLVADSDNAPLANGAYYDGVYLFKNGVLTPIHTATTQ